MKSSIHLILKLQKWRIKLALTHFSPVWHFYTPWKRQKTFGFLTFSGGIEMWPKVFWRFQGVKKCDTRLKWVKFTAKWLRPKKFFLGINGILLLAKHLHYRCFSGSAQKGEDILKFWQFQKNAPRKMFRVGVL